MHWRILHGDVREKLAELPAGCVQTCVTSPPYWALRDYGVAGQIGLEPTAEEFVANLVDVFRGVRHALADDGTLWMNLGDTYLQQQGNGFNGQKRLDHANRNVRVKRPVGVKPKDLVGIPWMVAFALRADGWYLRSDIIWSKPNPMPESITDRPTKAHEYIFLLSKRPRYYYNAAAIREPYAPSTVREFEDGYQGQARKDYAGTGAQNPSDVKRRIVDKQRGHGRRHAGFNDRWDAMPKSEQQMTGANKRTVWHVATQPYPDAHFATYPEKLIEPCILAGSRPGDTVLDPFCGSGTTGAVAVRHQRSFIGCELNAEYITLARKRIGGVAPLFAEPVNVDAADRGHEQPENDPART
jgi:DNA modification methylase